MALTIVESLALIFVVLGFIKIVAVLINKRAYFDSVVAPVFSSPKKMSVILGILAVIVLAFLLQELSIVTIVAVLLFASLVFSLSFMRFNKDMLAMAKKVYSQKFSGVTWAFVVVWVAILVWVLAEVFLF